MTDTSTVTTGLEYHFSCHNSDAMMVYACSTRQFVGCISCRLPGQSATLKVHAIDIHHDSKSLKSLLWIQTWYCFFFYKFTASIHFSSTGMVQRLVQNCYCACCLLLVGSQLLRLSEFCDWEYYSLDQSFTFSSHISESFTFSSYISDLKVWVLRHSSGSNTNLLTSERSNAR